MNIINQFSLAVIPHAQLPPVPPMPLLKPPSDNLKKLWNRVAKPQFREKCLLQRWRSDGQQLVNRLITKKKAPFKKLKSQADAQNMAREGFNSPEIFEFLAPILPPKVFVEILVEKAKNKNMEPSELVDSLDNQTFRSTVRFPVIGLLVAKDFQERIDQHLIRQALAFPESFHFLAPLIPLDMLKEALENSVDGQRYSFEEGIDSLKTSIVRSLIQLNPEVTQELIKVRPEAVRKAIDLDVAIEVLQNPVIFPYLAPFISSIILIKALTRIGILKQGEGIKEAREVAIRSLELPVLHSIILNHHEVALGIQQDMSGFFETILDETLVMQLLEQANDWNSEYFISLASSIRFEILGNLLKNHHLEKDACLAITREVLKRKNFQSLLPFIPEEILRISMIRLSRYLNLDVTPRFLSSNVLIQLLQYSEDGTKLPFNSLLKSLGEGAISSIVMNLISRSEDFAALAHLIPLEAMLMNISSAPSNKTTVNTILRLGPNVSKTCILELLTFHFNLYTRYLCCPSSCDLLKLFAEELYVGHNKEKKESYIKKSLRTICNQDLPEKERCELAATLFNIEIAELKTYLWRLKTPSPVDLFFNECVAVAHSPQEALARWSTKSDEKTINEWSQVPDVNLHPKKNPVVSAMGVFYKGDQNIYHAGFQATVEIASQKIREEGWDFAALFNFCAFRRMKMAEWQDSKPTGVASYGALREAPFRDKWKDKFAISTELTTLKDIYKDLGAKLSLRYRENAPSAMEPPFPKYFIHKDASNTLSFFFTLNNKPICLTKASTDVTEAKPAQENPEYVTIIHTAPGLQGILYDDYKKIFDEAMKLDDLEHLLAKLGEFFWLVCQAKPWKRGDPAIAEMIVRAALHSKGFVVQPEWKIGVKAWLEVTVEADGSKFGRSFADLFEKEFSKQ